MCGTNPGALQHAPQLVGTTNCTLSAMVRSPPAAARPTRAACHTWACRGAPPAHTNQTRQARSARVYFPGRPGRGDHRASVSRWACKMLRVVYHKEQTFAIYNSDPRRSFPLRCAAFTGHGRSLWRGPQPEPRAARRAGGGAHRAASHRVAAPPRTRPQRQSSEGTVLTRVRGGDATTWSGRAHRGVRRPRGGLTLLGSDDGAQDEHSHGGREADVRERRPVCELVGLHAQAARVRAVSGPVCMYSGGAVRPPV